MQHSQTYRRYPSVPRIGVGVLVLHGSEVLLVKRGQEPAKGEWSVPGGLVELGESVKEAAHREVREECNIHINLIKQIELFEFIEKDEKKSIKYHYVILDFLAEYVDGEPYASSDVSDTQWVQVSDLDRMDCNASIKKLVQKAFKQYRLLGG